MARVLRHIHPNVFTWLSLAAALFGGYAWANSGPDALGWLIVGWAMVALNSLFDLLDGKVASMTGKASAKGDYLDHSIDRFSDVAFLGGLTFGGWALAEVGLLAVAFTLLTSYLGTQAQAVGIGRNYSGLLGRADRMALLVLVPWIQFWLTRSGRSIPLPWTDHDSNAVELMLAYFAIVGFLTTMQRFIGGLRAFDADGDVR